MQHEHDDDLDPHAIVTSGGSDAEDHGGADDDSSFGHQAQDDADPLFDDEADDLVRCR